MSAFAELIRAARDRRGLTIEDVSDYVRVAPRTLSWWEAGKRLPASSCVLRLCEVLQVSYEDMLIALAAADEDDEALANAETGAEEVDAEDPAEDQPPGPDGDAGDEVDEQEREELELEESEEADGQNDAT